MFRDPLNPSANEVEQLRLFPIYVVGDFRLEGYVIFIWTGQEWAQL